MGRTRSSSSYSNTKYGVHHHSSAAELVKDFTGLWPTEERQMVKSLPNPRHQKDRRNAYTTSTNNHPLLGFLGDGWVFVCIC